jgi:transposase
MFRMDGWLRSWWSVPTTTAGSLMLRAGAIHAIKLNAVEPFAYLKDVLERLVAGRTKAHQLDELLPWQWKATSTVNP